MTREITRPSSCDDEQEAVAFGGPYWSVWKHSLLDHLGIEEFPDELTEKTLHKWWCLRMKLIRGIIDKNEFDKVREELFPEGGEITKLLDEDPNGVLARGIRYITKRISDKSDGDMKIRQN